MKNILPTLLSTLFFLMPLRLLAMEHGEDDAPEKKKADRQEQTPDNTRRAQIKIFQIQPQQRKPGSSAYGSTAVIEEKHDNETDSPLCAAASADTPPQRKTLRKKLSLEEFRTLATMAPEAPSCVLRDGSLLSESIVTTNQKEIATTWNTFFAALEKQYGLEGKTFATQMQSTFPRAEETGLVVYPALRAETIEATLIELDHLHATSLEKIRSSRVPREAIARAHNLEEISHWPSSSKINYNGYEYYATLSTPTDIASTLNAILRRTRNEREANRATLNAMSEELSNGGRHRAIKEQFQSRFRTRFILGQPISVSAFTQWKNSPDISSFFLRGTVIDACRGFRRLRALFPNTQSGYSRIPDPSDSESTKRSSTSASQKQYYQGEPYL